jgi:DNA replication protein DnaC
MQVLELARCNWIERRENVIALGPSGTGKTHVALGLGLAACQKGMAVSFTTAAALVNELMEARDERRLLRLQKQLAGVKLLIIDELGFVPLSKTGAELLFELISQRYERGSTMITSNLPFDEWTVSGGWIARRFQLDVVKFQGSRSSMRFLGCPAAMASRVAFR